jgi:putative endonuclease
MLVILSAAKNPRILFAATISLTEVTRALKALMDDHCYYVYILANSFHHLYTGVTNGLMVRVKQHKEKSDPESFTARYGIGRLVYFEQFQYIEEAIAREKQIKGWLRLKKIALIVRNNPTWRDLSEDWGKATEPFDEAKMKPPISFG